jgi:RNA polymerase sigma-70 factor (ECF subfamily)
MPTSPDHELDDRVLVERARAGEGDAYGELVRRHQAAALRLATVITGSTEEARDIVQEAFVAGYRAVGSYRGDAPPRSWLLRIVANHAKNGVRSRVRRRDRESRVVLVDRVAVAADEPAIERTEIERVVVALRQMSIDDREILGCRFVAGLAEAETASTLGLPVGTVKSRTARALGRLRSTMGEAAS